MSNIILTRKGVTDVCVPSRFLSDYMPGANGEYVKIYLYLLQCIQQNTSFCVSAMADLFEMTEKDISRALKYWESRGVISIEISGGCVSQINLLSPWDTSAPEDGSTAVEYQTSKTAGASREADRIHNELQNASSPIDQYELTPGQTRDVEGHPDFTVLTNLVKVHFKVTTINSIDYSNLMWVFFKMNMNIETCEALVEYCVEHSSRVKKIKQLMQLTAQCLEQDLTDTKAIKLYLNHEHHCQLVKKALGVSNKALASTEHDFVRRWFETLKMSDELVKEACARAVRNTESGRFEYTNKILTSWSESGISTMEQVAAADAAHKAGTKTRTGKASKQARSKNRFNNFEQRDIDFDEMEALVFGFDSKDTANSES